MESIQCMICRDTGSVEFVNICHENGHSSAKTYILELCGVRMQDYLQDDDVVCIKCMKFLHSCSEMKTKLCEIIVSRTPANHTTTNNSNIKPTQSSKPWETRLLSTPSTSAAFDYEGPIDGPSPNSLLIPTSSIPYDERSDTPSLDREVQHVNATEHRRRRRGNNWTRRKGSQSRSRSRSVSRNRSRLNNTASRASRTSTKSRPTTSNASSRKQMLKHAAELQLRRILSDFLYQNGSLAQFTRAYLGNLDISEEELADILTKPAVRTRFARDIRDKLLGEYEKFIFECPRTTCNETLYSLEDLTKHMVTKHDETAWFRCEQCKFSYLSKAHLEKHMDKHYAKFVGYCIYCSEEFKNKRLYEEHLNEHLVHSFPCIYCDRFFLTRQKCDNHIREVHPGRKKKIKRIKPQSILDRIDKNTEPEASQEEEDDTETTEFVIKVLTQPGLTKEDSALLLNDLNRVNNTGGEEELNMLLEREAQPSTSTASY